MIKKIKTHIKSILYKLVLSEKSPSKLALSFCIGNFIALSPTIPLQTPMAFALSWIFRLNPTVVVTTLYIINNPFTMIPIYVVDYMFGVWFFEKFLRFDIIKYNPSWVEHFNIFLSKYIDLKKYLAGSEFCLWCLLMGGLILSGAISIIIYPLMKLIFKKVLKQYENYYSK